MGSSCSFSFSFFFFRDIGNSWQDPENNERCACGGHQNAVCHSSDNYPFYFLFLLYNVPMCSVLVDKSVPPVSQCHKIYG